MFRQLSLVCTFVVTIGLAWPACAQEVVGGYCGEMTWQGQPPADVWVTLRRNLSWATAEDGALSAMDSGVYTQNGAILTMTGGQSPQYQITASVTGDRLAGDVIASDGRRGTISMRRMRGTGAGLRSSPIPPNFVVADAERALAGDMEGLMRAMSWTWTPQGVDYWGPIHDSGQLPDHAADALRDWIRRVQAGERAVCDAE